jgi:lipopolysaccharide export system protein LptA
MRGTRWLLILAILAILAGVGATYRLQRKILLSHASVKPARMPADLKSASEDWVYVKSEDGKPKATLRAHKVAQSKETGIITLEGVHMQIAGKTGDTHHIVKCEKAEFTQGERRLYSDGDTEITLDIPNEGTPKKKPVTIRTSGLTFEIDSNKASTSRLATFEFEHGEGKSMGAWYDPGAKMLHLTSQVEVNWKSPSPDAKPMKLEAGELNYQEGSGKIWLTPWARMTRENGVVESDAAVVTIDEGSIRAVEASKGRGTDTFPNRKLEYSADQLWVNFSDKGAVEKLAAEPHAHVVNSSDSSVTTMDAKRVELEFTNQNGESVLTHVLATGDSVAESKPVAIPGKTIGETRLLRSAVIDMKMRAGGKELESVEVPEPGTLEFIPNRPTDRHRTLNGSHMWIAYGQDNRIESFRTVDAVTQTDPTPEEVKRKHEPSKTSSKNMTAQFDPKTGQMSRIEQWDNFTYQEGERNARANRATLEQQQNLITLDTGARMWDSTGSTLADKIRLDQKTGNFEADGHVTSSRMPDQKPDPKKNSSDLLAGDQPMQAVAEKMKSSSHNSKVSYQGKVVLWQGANRIKGQQVDIDREQHTLMADGNVMTQFIDEQKDEKGQAKKPAAPVFTTVNAGKLFYTEKDRLAHYTGGVTLVRPGLDVKGAEIKAYLAEKGADNRLERAFSERDVTIVQKTPIRTRVGTGDHAEYYTENEKIVLRGVPAQLNDTLRGNTRGAQLTYFADDDHLLVDAEPQKSGASRLRGKKK